MVEIAESSELYGHAKHPYTKALFSAIPHPSTEKRAGRIILEGDIPSPMNPRPDVTSILAVGMQLSSVVSIFHRLVFSQGHISTDVFTQITRVKESAIPPLVSIV